ncbi:MAG: rod shape-determining protein MreD [Woeseiaceae bacterium]|jgi:rod shape-determining protein MreD|nr:rod shape-determining protein MreD [Woeseiaceae bacterium]
MNKSRASRQLPALMSFVVGLILTIMPLPEAAEAFRPNWLAMLVIFWTMQLPHTWSVGTAWIVGIVLDVSQGTLLGQHALALCCVAFIIVRFHLLMRVFPIPQLTAAVFPILVMYQFLLFWVNGVAGVDASLIVYWGPVISSTILWPVVMIFLSSLRYRTPSG